MRDEENDLKSIGEFVKDIAECWKESETWKSNDVFVSKGRVDG